MHFIIIAYDGTDDKALERRFEVRDEHLKLAKKLYDDKKWIFANGILDDNEKLIGSMIICEFSSKKELEEIWLTKEPYILNNVWQKITINKALIPDFFLN